MIIDSTKEENNSAKEESLEEIQGEENQEGGKWKILELTNDHRKTRSRIDKIKNHKKVVLTSGYFDPLHHGHIELFKLSKELGDYLIVVINNDIQTNIKKGYVFMPAEEKAKIIKELSCVDEVFISIDGDHPQCNTLAFLKPHIFAKGGDRYSYEIPETPTCRKHGIQIIDGVGAKVQSSSNLIEKSKEFLDTKE
jgi:cytidyltransferase-like protein